MSTSELLQLVERAGFVFKGRPVARKEEDDESSPSARAVTFTVEEVMRSTDAMRGLAGGQVVVVSEDARTLAEGGELILFTNFTSVGDPVVAQELGRRDASRRAMNEVREAMQEIEERPLRERVLTAELIVVGEVTAARPLEEPGKHRSEHDPEWWLARVTVQSVVKGRNRKNVDVLFANSEDIAWYQAPKLHEGAKGVVLLRSGEREERPEEAPAGAYLATHPCDFLPAERLPEVERARELEGRDS